MFNKKEYQKQYQIKYRLEHKEEKRKHNKKHRQKNIEYYKEYGKEWRKNNPRYKKEYFIKNKRRILEQNQQWKKENRNKANELQRIWQRTEKGKANTQRGSSKRRARERDIINTLTAQEWLDVLERYNYRCAYCDVEFEVENMPTKDHIIPIIAGGNNTKENIVPACKSCNCRKNDKLDYSVKIEVNNYE